ncbi:S1 RNA-binding domain-containing protein 1-like [Phlebotomus argentipes]|uniref:S1 RNA-binding domain-containing protein 1-like n=1 Tax=Phlebotomus argentipes TaxID=94469 RepID=UPI002892F135|nr:S1 RNA-binding domain-containing protein 1-like [Phlebotomus argentipes]
MNVIYQILGIGFIVLLVLGMLIAIYERLFGPIDRTDRTNEQITKIHSLYTCTVQYCSMCEEEQQQLNRQREREWAWAREQEYLEKQRQQQVRRERERQEQERQKIERRERARQELARWTREQQLRERQERERQERERQEFERRERERQELERRKREQQLRERQERERQERERQEFERQERERQEVERRERERQELMRRKRAQQKRKRQERKRRKPKIKMTWSIASLVAEIEGIKAGVAKKIDELCRQNNTISFICRYRSHMIGNLKAQKIRQIRETFANKSMLKERVNGVAKILHKSNVLTDDLRRMISRVKSIEQLDYIYDIYKPSGKKWLEKVATKLGLLRPAKKIFAGNTLVNFNQYVNHSVKQLNTVTKVETGIAILVASLMMKSEKMLKLIQVMTKNAKNDSIELHSTQAKGKTSQNSSDFSKYELYFDFKAKISNLTHYQVLTINRGDKNKKLLVHIVIPTKTRKNHKESIFMMFKGQTNSTPKRNKYLRKIINEMYSRKIVPLITKQIRQDITKDAVNAAIQYYADSYWQYILMSNEKILGIDPGFADGCKLAMISEDGEVLDTTVIYPHSQIVDRRARKFVLNALNHAKTTLRLYLQKYNCRIIALGNGTGCHETEVLLEAMKEEFNMNFTYCITSDQGAFEYSCSNSVIDEFFPCMDVNLIGAIFIARKHKKIDEEFSMHFKKLIFEGVYHHNPKYEIYLTTHVAESLDEILEECRSFVGVDINTTDETCLRFMAGISPEIAHKIILYRQKHGSIESREKLRNLIDKKAFRQCAGFVTIDEKTSGKRANPLDRTWMHPESYHIARGIINYLGLLERNIGEYHFMEMIKRAAEHPQTVQLFAKSFSTSAENVRSICKMLARTPLQAVQEYREDVYKQLQTNCTWCNQNFSGLNGINRLI